MDSASFHHYEILKTADGRPFELGRGAMGVTFKAIDTKLQCLVALKVINPAILSGPMVRERFIREARAAARLRHPNVASVIYLSYEAEPCFYAMEFIEGETMDALIKRRGPLDAGAALHIVLQVCEALAAAHRSGIIHRDIKPSNLMLCQHGDTILVKVIDFGLAKYLAAEGDASTLTQGLVGTPLFASPEQLDGREVDTRSDMYSLGVTLWYLLGGRTPFAGSIGQVISQQLNRPPPLEELNRQPPCIVSLLGSMLQKNPADRPQTPAELKSRIQACLHEVEGSAHGGEAETIAARSETASSGLPPATPTRSVFWVRTVAATTVLVALAGTGYYVVHSRISREVVSTNGTKTRVAPTPRPELPVTVVPSETPPAAGSNANERGDFTKPAESNDSDDVVKRAAFLLDRGAPGDADEAFKALATSSDPRALNLLGLCYAQGRGTTLDEVKARELFEQAHLAGDFDASSNLAVLYMKTDVNPMVVRQLVRKGAEAGNANCMNSYADCLWGGSGGAVDREEALRWYRKAAEMGHGGAKRSLEKYGY